MKTDRYSLKKAVELAGCIIRDNQGGILLLHRNTAKRRQWEIPGGKTQAAESAAGAAIRELHEELGVGVKVIKKLGSTDFTEDGFRLTYAWFLAEISSGVPVIKEPEIFDDYRYFSREELQTGRYELSRNLQNFLECMKQGEITL